MLRASRSCARAVSPLLQRRANMISPISWVQKMSTSSSSKQSKTSKKSEKASKPATSPPLKGVPAASQEPVEKGDSYASGKEFFSYNSYSFYDIENSVQPLRCPQPSSEKAP